MAAPKRIALLKFEFCQTNNYDAFGPIVLNITDCNDEEDLRRVFVQEMSRTTHYGDNLVTNLADWHDLAFHFQGQDGEECLSPIDMELLEKVGPKTVVSAHITSSDGTSTPWTTNSTSYDTGKRLHEEVTPSIHSNTSDMTDMSPYWQGSRAQQSSSSTPDVRDKRHVSRALFEAMEEPSSDEDSNQQSQPVMVTNWLKRKHRDEVASDSVSSTSAKKPRTSIATNKPRQSRREAVLSPGIKAVQAADQDDGCRYIRVGELPGDFASAERAIDKHSIVVAIVEPAVDQPGSKPQVVKCMAVDTYKINGIEVGDYDSADRDLTLAKTDFCPDDYWKTVLAEMAAKRGIPANIRDLDYAVVKYSNQTPHYRGPRPDSKRTPLRPRHSLSSWTNTLYLKNHHRGEINAVITFANDVANTELGLPRNLQASLDFDEDFRSFKKYVLSQKGHHGSLHWMLTDDVSPINYWADIRIWVLPTVAGTNNREMYEWTESSGKLAKDFLDESHVERFGRNLYIEVRIVEDADAERKDAEWVRRMAVVAGSKPTRDMCATPTTARSGIGGIKRPSPWSLLKSFSSPYRNARAGGYLSSYERVGRRWCRDDETDQDDAETIEIKAEPGED